MPLKLIRIVFLGILIASIVPHQALVPSQNVGKAFGDPPTAQVAFEYRDWGDVISSESFYVPPSPISGNIKVIMVTVQFKDLAGGTPPANIASQKVVPMMSYYTEVSYGTISISGSYLPNWLTLPNTRAYYGANVGTVKDVNINRFILDSINAADPSIDYREYGYVIIVHAGNSESSSGNPNDIWSCATLGKEKMTTGDGDVSIGIAILAETSQTPSYAHEFGHNLGLPDLYDVDYKQEFVGPWSLMDFDWLSTPQHLMAVEKAWLGWIPSSQITNLSQGQIANLTVSKLETKEGTLAVKIPIGTTYYMVEYRRKVLSDVNLPAEGVIISYVDESLGNGKGIVKVKDARPNSAKYPLDLWDAPFVGGMRFVDGNAEVAVKVRSLGMDSATITAQKGFADLVAGSVEAEGRTVERSPITFKISIKNAGVTASNYALASLRIDGVGVQRKGIPSISAGSTFLLKFDPWVATLGTHTIQVVLDVNDDVVEKSEANNIGYMSLEVVPLLIVIDKSSVSNARANVNSTQSVIFHAVWGHNNSNVVNGIVYVNNVKYYTDSAGWVKISATSSLVGKQTWKVTGVDVADITKYVQEAPDQSIVWDKVKVTLSVPRDRIDVGTTAQIRKSGVYLYDNTTFDGSITLNEDPTKTVVGKYEYKAIGISGGVHGITVFETNSVFVIFDRMEVFGSGVSDDRCDVGTPQRVWVKVRYDYDRMAFDSSKGSLSIGNRSATWDSANQYWYIEDSRSTIGKNDYSVPSSFVDNAYGITVITGKTTRAIIWDRVQTTLTIRNNRINVGANATVIIAGIYSYDNVAFQGTFTLNDTQTTYSTVGKRGYRVSAISDKLYGLTSFTTNEMYVIWDSVSIDIQVVAQRIGINRNATILVRGIYDYDKFPFNGKILLNNTVYSYGTVGRRAYTAAGLTGDVYGITVISHNDIESVIWDKIRVEHKEETTTPSFVKTQIRLNYEYDNTPVEDASVLVNGVKAQNMGRGSYEAILSTWSPYLTLSFTIEKTDFDSSKVETGVYAIGNLAVIMALGSIAVVLLVFLVTRRRKPR